MPILPILTLLTICSIAHAESTARAIELTVMRTKTLKPYPGTHQIATRSTIGHYRYYHTSSRQAREDRRWRQNSHRRQWQRNRYERRFASRFNGATIAQPRRW